VTFAVFFVLFSRDIPASVEMPSPKRLAAHAHRPPPWVKFAAAVAALALPGSAPARAETSCYAESCTTVCAPAAPVAISPLVVFSDFPVTADADTPVAFIDPGDGRTRRLIPTQEGTIWVWDG